MRGWFTGRKERSGLHPAAAVGLDVLLTGVILLIYLFFNQGAPAMYAALGLQREPVPAPAAATLPTAVPAAEAAESAEPAVSPSPEADNRTEWQKRFADHFSDTVVLTDNSYTSPNVSITIDTVEESEGRNKAVYYVADIYIASPENFRTCTANNELQYYSRQDAMEMDMAAGALLSISGDFYAFQRTGFLIRNGEIYRQDYAYCDICVMYEDGSVENYAPGEYDIDEIMARGVAQVWNFGPSLLDAEGHVYESYNVATAVSYPNPRSAFGYYEPGHYCFVVVDGRQENGSRGMTIPQLAAVFERLGCASAYNMDGGGSALMVFNHQRFSSQSNGADRRLSDLLVIVETEGIK